MTLPALVIFNMLQKLPGGLNPLPQPEPTRPKPKRPPLAEPAPSFSLFGNCKANTPSEALTLSALVSGVRDGVWRADVAPCRAILKKEGADAYKKSRGAVPAVTLSACVKHRRTGTTPEQRGAVHSGLLQIDIDATDHPGRSVEDIRATVEAAPFIAACFVSLSGQGVKGVARVPASIAQHGASWLAAAEYFKERGLTVDPSTKDLCRLCFVSFDPEVFTRPDAAEIVPLEVPVSERATGGGASGGTEDPVHVHRVLERLAEKIGPYQNRLTWIHIVGSTVDAVGPDDAGEIVDQYFPPAEEWHDRAGDVAPPLTGTWLSLRKYGIDPEDHTKALPYLEPGDDEAHREANESEFDPFPITLAGDMEGTAEALDFVEGMLTEGGASVVYGPSNCGKSFWVLDLSASIATATPFRGNIEVDRGAVIYVALEGSHGARNRIEALKRAGRLPAGAPLFLCFAPVSLLKRKHAAKLAASVRLAAEKSGMPCRLVILDTLARAMAGGDENRGQDMGAAVKTMDAIRAATGAHVLLVHHCGKNEALGARGHSSLRAAVDTEIEISRPEGQLVSTVLVTKQRDLSPGEPMPFSLKVVTLGIGRRGKPITSCVVHHEDTTMASKPGKAGRKAICTAEDMLQFLPAASVREWQEKVEEETGLKSSGFYANKKGLEDSKRIRRENSPKRILRNDPADSLPDITE